MTPRCLVTVTIVMLSYTLTILSPPATAYGPLRYACCVRYTRTPLDISVIMGYIEQSSLEVCRLDAIIFYIKGNKKVCANKNAPWVRRILERLSVRLKNMSAKETPILRSDWTHTIPPSNVTNTTNIQNTM